MTVGRATLHNYDETAKKDVRVGDEVFIIRAGEVIPEVIAPIAEIRDGTELAIIAPLCCPSCGHVLAREEGKVAIFCPNSALCPAQSVGALKWFVSKYGANVLSLGDKIIDQFVACGFLTDFASIYRLSEHRDAILQLEGFKEKKIGNILESIETSRNMSIGAFLFALGIPQVGRKTGKVLEKFLMDTRSADIYPDGEHFSPEGFLSSLASVPFHELEGINGIGTVCAAEILAYIMEQADMFASVVRELQLTTQYLGSGSGNGNDRPLYGKSFCVTGSFDSHSRDEIHAMIEARGGETRSSVSKELGFLVVGEAAGSKKEKAEKLGVSSISLDELMGMMEK